jgi:hypothetical protein
MFQIENSEIEAQIHPLGAELRSLKLRNPSQSELFGSAMGLFGGRVHQYFFLLWENSETDAIGSLERHTIWRNTDLRET